MKRQTGFSVWGVIVGVVIVALLGLATYAIIDGNSKATNFEAYDFNSIIEPSVDNGYIGDHVKGDKNAPVVIFEYADFQCPGCSGINPRVNAAIEKLDGKLAVVYRNYLLSYHQNGTAAASAAEAAGLQGYWKEYGDILFSEQAEWEYASASERTMYFEKYFEKVTGGNGDLVKFREDMASSEVSKKISFDMGIGKRVDIYGTPAFYIDGQWINWSEAAEIMITSVGGKAKKISWEESQGGEKSTKLLEKIVEAKLDLDEE